ncbi:MAG: YlxR family protein [Clostridia bacterium]|nr:YlxR family protein [Clostridia bacterium]
MKEKKIPLRMCTGCGEMKPKSELVRIVRSPEGEISLDLSGRKNGRGSYICKSVECFDKAVRKKAFERAFKVRLSDELVMNIREEIK